MERNESSLKYGEIFELNIGYVGNKALYVGIKSIDGNKREEVIQRGKNETIWAYYLKDFKREGKKLIINEFIAKELKGLEKKFANERLKKERI
jgi:hypothetical protein